MQVHWCIITKGCGYSAGKVSHKRGYCMTITYSSVAVSVPDLEFLHSFPELAVVVTTYTDGGHIY